MKLEMKILGAALLFALPIVAFSPLHAEDVSDLPPFDSVASEFYAATVAEDAAKDLVQEAEEVLAVKLEVLNEAREAHEMAATAVGERRTTLIEALTTKNLAQSTIAEYVRSDGNPRAAFVDDNTILVAISNPSEPDVVWVNVIQLE